MRVGSRVKILSRGTAIVQSLSKHSVHLQMDGNTLELPRWQVSRLPDPGDGDADALVGMLCLVCGSGIPPAWTVGAGCVGEPHGLCGECRNTWMWAEFNAYNLPLRCPQCQSECSVAHLRALINRGTEACWQTQKQHWHTDMSYEQFLSSIGNRLVEMGDIETRVRHIRELINTDQRTPHPIAYCQVAGAPAFRVCPRCASVIEYESQCKHMTCRCGHSFCWLCTKDAGQHAASGDLDWNINFSCPIAPVQSEEEIRQILSRQR